MRLPRHAYGHKTRSSGLGGLLRSRFSLILVGLFLVFMYWQANQTEVPFSGRKQLNTVSIEKEVELGRQSYVQILSQEQQQGNDVLCASGTVCAGEAAEYTRAVREIGLRLQAAAVELEQELLQQGASFTPVADQFEWTYYVVDSNTPNAFCLPGGYVAVYTGILDITGDYDGSVDTADLNDLDKLAVVMGHEIGHALAHHGAERVSQQRVVQFGQIAVGVGLGDMDASQQRAIMQAFGIAAQGGMLAYSRKHETEADKIGLDLLVRACYDPREAPELWERMGQIGGGQPPPEWMSTPPASETRAENFREWMPEAIAEYERRCGPLG
jgi:predicted Zn-dependent protease